MDRKIEFDFMGRSAAPTVDHYVFMCEHHTMDGTKVSSKAAIALLEKVFETLKSIKPKSYDDREIVELFLEAPRGTIEEFGDYEELRGFGEYKNYREFKKAWKWYHPDPSTWYALASLSADNGYKAIFMNNRISLSCYPGDKDYGKVPDDMEE